MKALVTGGAGFIGSHLCEYLVRKGWDVRILDDFSTGKRENLGNVKSSHLEIIEGSVADEEVCKSSVEGVNAVFHLAALCSVPKSVEQPELNHVVNVTGTFNVMNAARLEKVDRFVFISSSAVYGDSDVCPKTEDMPLRPASPYAAAKAAGELYAYTMSKLYGMPVMVLRYFNVYGPRQDPAGPYAAVVASFLSKLAKGERPVIYGDGEQTRDLVYVEDCVRATYACLSAPEDAFGLPINIAGGGSVTVRRLFDAACAAVGRKEDPEYRPPRPGDVKHSFASIEKAERYLSYRPSVNIEKGLELTARWFLK